MTEVKKQIRDFIIENFLFGEANGLSDEASLLEEGILDSTGVLELLTFLEEDFGIHVEDDELIPENLDSIVKAAAFTAYKIAHSAAEPLSQSDEA